MQTAEPTPPPVPEHPPVAPTRYVFARDLPCIACGYNLRTMEVTARCPECATACEASFGSLHAGRAEQLTRIASGLMWMAWPALFLPLVGFGLMMFDIWYLESNGPRASNVGGIGVGIVGPILAWIGVRRMRRGVDADETARGLRSRVIVDGLVGVGIASIVHAVAAAALTVLSLLLVHEVIWVGNDEEPMVWLIGVLATAMALAWTLRNTLVTRRCWDLARRSDAKVLRRMFLVMSGVSWVMSGAVFAYAAIAVLARVFHREIGDLFNNNPGLAIRVFQGVGITVYLVSWLTVLVWMLAWPIMLSTMARHLRRVSKKMSGPVVDVRPEEDPRHFSPA